MSPPQAPVKPAFAGAQVAAHNQRDHQNTHDRAPPMAAEADELRNALRIQAAAVAAQQAAVLEMEFRLHEQQQALTQQEEQLASHLDEKQQRLLQLNEQVQAARAELRQQQQDHAAVSLQQIQELAEGKAELAKGQKQLLAERQRVKRLRRRLKKHCQRQLAAEHMQLRHREAAVTDQHRRIEKEAEKLQIERDALAQARAAFNGEMELGKRRLHGELQKLHKEQQLSKQELQQQLAELESQAQTLRQRESAVGDAKRALAEEQLAWQRKRTVAEREWQGLESRIANQRRKLAEAGQGAPEPGQKVDGHEKESCKSPELPSVTPPVCPLPAPCPDNLPLSALHELAEELADQRLLLVEHWLRLTESYKEWDHTRAVAADQLAAVARAFPEKERELLNRQEALETAEVDLRRRREELLQFRRHLEGWAARVRVRESAWEGERDCVVADARGREAAAGKQSQALAALRQTWSKRRRQELELLHRDRASCEKLRREAAALRQECLKRNLALDQEHRDLAEKALALEEYRQRFVLRSQDAAAVEAKLERLRKRWVKQNGAMARATAEQNERLRADAMELHQRGKELVEIAETLETREADLAQRQSAAEKSATAANAEQVSLQQQLRSALVQRDRGQRQIAELQAELDRLARLLIDESEEVTIQTASAA